jgi:plasmid maintenance system killer protein
MATGGWKTASMFRRYAIVSSADQQSAMQALEQARQLHLRSRDENSSSVKIEQNEQRIQ